MGQNFRHSASRVLVGPIQRLHRCSLSKPGALAHRHLEKTHHYCMEDIMVRASRVRSLELVVHGQQKVRAFSVAIFWLMLRHVLLRKFPLVAIPVRDAPLQLIADLHGDLLREISALMCLHWQGLGQPARALRKRNIFDATQAKKLILLDGAHNLPRHITVISSNEFRMSISNSIKLFAGTKYVDPPAPVNVNVTPPP